ncbi:Solute carrier organic anion transporter family member 1A2, partial [Ophiophagus hannah]
MAVLIDPQIDQGLHLRIPPQGTLFCSSQALLRGLPAPIYFGALIDQTCLKWGRKTCGGSGACRVYDTKAFSQADKESVDGWMDGWMDGKEGGREEGRKG